MGFYFVTTGWILEISLCENSINQNQSINELRHSASVAQLSQS